MFIFKCEWLFVSQASTYNNNKKKNIDYNWTISSIYNMKHTPNAGGNVG
jgi:hypothetical protein